MKLLKQISTYTLCFITILILLISSTSCKESLNYSSSSNTTSSNFNDSNLSGSSNGNSWDDTSSSDESSSNMDSSSSTNDTTSSFLSASVYDITFDALISDKKNSALIELTPKYHIYNLQVEILLLLSNSKIDSHIYTFEKAPAQKTISLCVDLSEDYLSSNSTISVCSFKILDGKCAWFNGGFFYSKTYTSNSSSEDLFDDYTQINFDISKDKKSVLINLSSNYDLYNVIFGVNFELNGKMYYSLYQNMEIDYLHQGEIFSYRFYLPEVFIAQGLLIDNVYAACNGRYKGPSDSFQTATDRFWSQFE